MTRPSSSPKSSSPDSWGEPTPMTWDVEDPAWATIHVRYLEPSQLVDLLQTSHVAGVVAFGEPFLLPDQGMDSLPVTHIPLTPFKHTSKVEVWLGTHSFSYTQVEALQMAYNSHYLFGSVQVSESDEISLEELTNEAYQLILNQIAALGYSHLFRVWNYFPKINSRSRNLERYQQFCIGRHRAFSSQSEEYQSILPAATAVGTPGGPLSIYFIAGKQPGVHVENPRQMSAYQYPSTYGPKSPSFSRATVAISEDQYHLFVAGTASIVGHATQHPGDSHKQAQETLRNIDAVVGHAQELFPATKKFGRRPTLLKVYVRNREHFLDTQEIVTKHLGEGIEILYLQGDVCRSDLLLEIEVIL